MAMFSLRPEQLRALEDLATEARNAANRALILMAPCAFGKTVVAAELCRRAIAKGKRVLFLVPRRELGTQARDKLLDAGLLWGRDVGLYMAGVVGAEEIGSTAAVTVASKDTLVTRLRLGRIQKLPTADLVIVDECHLSTSATWLKLLEHYRKVGALIVGLSATPGRKGGKGLGVLYDAIVPTASVRELTDLGYLSPARYFSPTKPDLAKLRKVRGDYAEKDLAERVNTPAHVGDVVANYLEKGEARQTICFAVDRRHSIELARRFSEAGASARHVDGTMNTAEREELLRAFANGEFSVLCNCMIATYGLDIPSVSCLVLARPTASIVLHVQMLGRGLRIHPGKEDCLVFDHAGNIERLGMADTEHEWSLDSGAEEPKPKKIPEGHKIIENMECQSCKAVFKPQPECPECGHVFKPKGAGVQWIKGQLVELSKTAHIADAAGRKLFYRELLGWCEKHNKKPGIAFYRYKDRFGVKPPFEWQKLPPLEPSQSTMNHIQRGLIAWRTTQKKSVKALPNAS